MEKWRCRRAYRARPMCYTGMCEEVTMARSFRIESTVRGHHVYKTRWSPSIGEELCCEVEEDNTFDRYAVAVTKDERVVGHVPRELARICYFFLKKQHSTMTCTVTDKRRPSDGKGLVVPCIYIFNGKERHVQKLISCFT